MTTDRIKEIQSKTAYPESISVQKALLQVWNECEQEQLAIHNVVVTKGRLRDLDGKQVMVRFKVTKHIPKIVIDDI